ncbi:MAG: hypothetical protein OXN96_01715 [Bryobacterales bacterium]|nr:hypothetical protein [Bryobacterales bacterium]
MLGRASAVGLLAVCSAGAQDAIYFERVFPGSIPDRFEVRLTVEGVATYSEDGEDSVDYEVGRQEAALVFDWAADLGYFSRSVASKRKVASTGRKLLRYEAGGQLRGETVFDYTEEPAARELASWFVRLAETQQHLQTLERLYRFDRLGVDQALVSLQSAFERDRIVAPRLLEPILNKIAEQDRIVHVARARARGMLERIHASPFK